MVPNLGLVPCMIMNERKTRPPAQTIRMVNAITPTKPVITCQSGMVTVVDILINIRNGVKGGNKDKPTANDPPGSWITGNITNNGIKIGNIAANCMFCASFESRQDEPKAAIIVPYSTTAIIMKIKNQGNTS